MSQNDFTIANQTFPNTRVDLNGALQALASNNSGATEPSTMFAYQFWHDTTLNLLKIRDDTNSAWITIAAIDLTNDRWEIRSNIIQAASTAGITLKSSAGATILSISNTGVVTTVGNVAVTGNITVTGTVDGVDIAAEETRLANTSGTNTGDEPDATTSVKGIVEKATIAEAEAGTSADKFPDVVGVKAAIEALSVFTLSYESTGQTITTSSTATMAHGLGVEPQLVTFWLKCTAADGGYSIGDVVQASLSATTAAYDAFNALSWDATNVYFYFTDTGTVFTVGQKGGGTEAHLTNSKWDLYVRAWA
jgi:hypothetical protein